MDYAKILDEAYNAATAAILAKFKAGDSEQPFNCGFAWVTIDGTDGLARYCRKMIKELGDPRKLSYAESSRYGDKGYPSGWQFWGPGEWPTKAAAGVDAVYAQDMDFKAAGARAFQEVLANYGIRATVGTRLD